MQRPRAVRTATTLIICGAGLWFPSSAIAQADLERARLFYNAGKLDAAISSAEVGRNKPAIASSARLIIARSRLERFRLLADPQDLEAARMDLISLNPLNLSRQETIEWQIGLGEILFLENEAGPASEIFKTVIPSARAQLTSVENDKLIEWWAASLSRMAESLNGNARVDKYRELLSLTELELERESTSRAATYWVVVAARGTGDLDRAWNAAIAGWIRASSLPHPQELRADLERFVLQTVVPERAQAHTGQRLDRPATMVEITAMTAEWQDLIRRWSGKN